MEETMDQELKNACALMREALDKYESGDIEGGDRDREQANFVFDNVDFSGAAVDAEEADDALYTESRNFGIIYNVLEANLKEFIKDNKNKSAVRETINFIKTNKVLHEQFNWYNTLENTIVKENLNEYMDQAMDLVPRFERNKIKEENEKLIKLMRKHKMNECIGISDDKLKLYESIEYFLLNKKSIKNINEFTKNKNVIKEYISENSSKASVNEETYGKDDYDNLYKETYNKLSEEITEDVELLLQELNENDPKDVFKKYKSETMKFITEQISKSLTVEDKIDWNNILTKIALKEYDESKVLEDVTSFVNIQSVIEE